MHAKAIINNDGGSVKSLNIDDYCEHLEKAFKANGHSIAIQTTSGQNLIQALEAAAKEKTVDILIGCGGDGTISAAATHAYKYNKIFGLLPAGTMNLFARSLGIPLDLYKAAEVIACSNVKPCDLASANERIFVHQYSIGIQPRLIEERDGVPYPSKVTKALGGLSATLSVLTDPVSYCVDMDNTGKQQVALIAVSNNPYGKDHLPYADDLNSGKLGLYWVKEVSRVEETMVVADILSGNWNNNPNIHRDTASKLTLKFHDLEEGAKASIDGELIDLEPEVNLKVLPAALKVLMPKTD